MAQTVKNLSSMWEIQVRSLRQRREWQPTPVFLLENAMDRGAWQAIGHGVPKSWTWLSTFFTFNHEIYIFFAFKNNSILKFLYIHLYLHSWIFPYDEFLEVNDNNFKNLVQDKNQFIQVLMMLRIYWVFLKGTEHILLFFHWKWKVLSCVRLFATPWTIQSMKFSRPEYWSG